MAKVETPKKYNKRRWAELESEFHEHWLRDITEYRRAYEEEKLTKARQ